MILLSEQPCIMRESDDGDRFQRCPFPPRGYSYGGALVLGLSAEHAPCRRTHGGTGGGGGSLHDQPVGHQVQPAAGGGIPPAQAPGVGQLVVYKNFKRHFATAAARQ